MLEKYRKFRDFDPFAYFQVNMGIFCVFMWLYGVFLLEQDPTGTMLVAFFTWILAGSGMAMLYTRSLVDEWGYECPYSQDQIKAWKHQTTTMLYYTPRKGDWEDLNMLACDMCKWDEKLEYDYAAALVIWAQSVRMGMRYVPKEAQEYIKQNPKIWNVVKNA